MSQRGEKLYSDGHQGSTDGQSAQERPDSGAEEDRRIGRQKIKQVRSSEIGVANNPARL
jgi:hypothetical protein